MSHQGVQQQRHAEKRAHIWLLNPNALELHAGRKIPARVLGRVRTHAPHFERKIRTFHEFCRRKDFTRSSLISIQSSRHVFWRNHLRLFAKLIYRIRHGITTKTILSFEFVQVNLQHLHRTSILTHHLGEDIHTVILCQTRTRFQPYQSVAWD